MAKSLNLPGGRQIQILNHEGGNIVFTMVPRTHDDVDLDVRARQFMYKTRYAIKNPTPEELDAEGCDYKLW